MAGAEGPEIASIGCTASTPGIRVIDLAAARGRAATRKAARLITSDDVLAKALGDGVCPPAVVEELAGGRVRDDALEGRVSEEFTSDVSRERPCPDELRRAIAQRKERGQVDCQVDVGPRPWKWGPDLIRRICVSGWILRIAVEEQGGEGQRALLARAHFRRCSGPCRCSRFWRWHGGGPGPRTSHREVVDHRKAGVCVFGRHACDECRDAIEVVDHVDVTGRE